MSTYLVATDFSPHSERALEHALALAKLFRARIELFTSAYIPPQTLAAMAAGMSPSWIQEARDQAKAQLEALSAKVAPQGVAVSTSLSTEEPSTAICARANEVLADLVALGTRGHTGLAHVLFGSVAERVARLTHSPVLVAHDDTPAPGGYRRVLVPTDFSADADLALAWARVLVEKTGGKLVLIHAYDMPAIVTGGVAIARASLGPALEADAREKLGALRDSLAGCEVETVVSHGRPDTAILDAAESARADLIVMGTRGRTGLAHVVMGSTAERVLRRAKAPVVTVKTRPDGI